MTPDECENLLEALRVISPLFDQSFPFQGIRIAPEREHALHECLHLMLLGMPFVASSMTFVSNAIGEAISGMGVPYARENEMRTLAAELVILRALGAITKTGERRFLGRISKGQRIRHLRRIVTQWAEEPRAKEDAEQIVPLILEWAERRRQFVAA